MSIDGVRREGPYERVVREGDAAQHLPEILRRVSTQREDFLITDDAGKTLGLLVNAERFEELGELLSLARNTYSRLNGETPVPHDQFARDMGLEPTGTDSMRQQPGDAS